MPKLFFDGNLVRFVSSTSKLVLQSTSNGHCTAPCTVLTSCTAPCSDSHRVTTSCTAPCSDSHRVMTSYKVHYLLLQGVYKSVKPSPK